MNRFRITYMCVVCMCVLTTLVAALSINVSQELCDSTIELTQHQEVYLNYDGRRLGNGGCTYTITNSNSGKQMCIKENPHKTSMNCMLVFSYSIGRRSTYSSTSCMDFILQPVCTREYKVFASFHDSLLGSFDGLSLSLKDSANVIVYLQSPPPSPTHKTNTYSNAGGSSSSYIGVVVIISLILLIICCICCWRWNRTPNKPIRNRGLARTGMSHNTRQTGNVIRASAPVIRRAGSLIQWNGLHESTESSSNYDWGPPDYHTAVSGQDHSYHATGTGHTSDQSPFTITTGTCQHHSSDVSYSTEMHESSAPSTDQIDEPPSYDSLDTSDTCISHL